MVVSLLSSSSIFICFFNFSFLTTISLGRALSNQWDEMSWFSSGCQCTVDGGRNTVLCSIIKECKWWWEYYRNTCILHCRIFVIEMQFYPNSCSTGRVDFWDLQSIRNFTASHWSIWIYFMRLCLNLCISHLISFGFWHYHVTELKNDIPT